MHLRKGLCWFTFALNAIITTCKLQKYLLFTFSYSDAAINTSFVDDTANNPLESTCFVKDRYTDIFQKTHY